TVALAQCVTDWRNARWIDHTVEELLRQRIYGQGLGYEDVNDHEQLRTDPLLAVACEKLDPLGEQRVNRSQTGIALAAPSTLNRLELSNNKHTRYHKIEHEPAKVEACVLQLGVCCVPKEACEIVLDLDAMGHLLHGQQEGAHFNRYYEGYVVVRAKLEWLCGQSWKACASKVGKLMGTRFWDCLRNQVSHAL